MQTGQRPGKAGDLVRYDAITEGGIAFGILVGVDQQFSDLWRQALRNPVCHWPPVQQLQALVHATHAPAKATSQNDAGNRGPFHQYTSVHQAGSSVRAMKAVAPAARASGIRVSVASIQPARAMPQA